MAQQSNAPATQRKRGLGVKIKEIFSELKKVAWPSFKKTLKQTGVVLGIVTFFTIIVSLMDAGLSKLLELLVRPEK